MKWCDKRKVSTGAPPAISPASPLPLRMLAVVATGLALCAGSVSAEGPQLSTESPEATIESLHSGLLALAEEQTDAGAESSYRALLPLIVATHDLEFIAEFTIRRHWPSLGETDRSRFTAAFEHLSVMTYASRFAGVDANTFAPVETSSASSGRAEVHSAIRRPNDGDIPLEYVLQHGEGGWRIINIVVDGVSDLALKRAEYQSVIAEGGINGLLAHIDEQVARLVN
jgi:phospholipid transport system substrate-binding protein